MTQLAALKNCERVFTLDQLQHMLDGPTQDRSYQQTRLGPAVREHLAWKALAGRSESTLDDYERTLARLCVRLPGRQLEEVTVGDLMLLLESWPPASRRKRKAALNGFFTWAVRQARIDRNPCDLLPEIKRPAQQVLDIFDAAELAALLQAARQSILPLANTVRVGLLSHGLRKGGCLGLRVRDVNLTDRLILVTEKGGKQRLVPFRGDLVRHLDEYLLTPYPLLDRQPGPEDFFFFPYGATRDKTGLRLLWVDPARSLSRTGYTMWWKRLVAEAGFPYRKPHMMRHTYGTNATDADVDLATLQELMGHASPATTALYVHSSRTRLDGAAERIERFRRAAFEGVRSEDA